MRINLIGFKCSGKTTIGKLLAPALGFKFLDLDDLIEAKYGLSIPDLFSKIGEPDFRKIEYEVYNEIPLNNNLVLATGGGFPRWENNMDVMLGSGITVYIRADNNILFERMSRVSFYRPIIKGMKDESLMEYITTLKANYEHIYTRATITYDSRNMPFIKLVEEIDSLVRKGSGSK